MDSELLKELGLVEENSLKILAYAQNCVLFYEETIKAMGLLLPEFISQAVKDSQIAYQIPAKIGDEYANIPEHY